MKHLLSLLFIGLLFQVNAQKKLEGNYCQVSESKVLFDQECIDFKLDGTFEYSRWECTGTIKGVGDYKKKCGTLILNVTDVSSVKRNSIISKKETDLKENEKALVSIQLYNLQDSTSVDVANIILLDSLLKEQPIRGTVTDQNGKTEIEIQNENLVKINHIFFEDLKIPISNKKHTEIIVYLTPNKFTNYLAKGTEIKYKIKQVKSTHFLLRKMNEKEFVKFSKEQF